MLSPGTGAIVPADAVPAATTGPGRLSMLDGLAAEERAAVLARWDDSGCAPWTLMVDQHNGELTLEEYTELSYRSLFQPQPSGEAPHEVLGPELPERYVVCDDQASIEALGFTAGVFIHDIDPEFRDRLWLELTGRTFADANRPLTDEELDDALRHFESGDVTD